MRAIALNIFWWAVTLVVLFVIDDLMYGPIFWAISVWNQLLATILAFVFSVVFDVWLIRICTVEKPNRVAAYAIKRLRLEPKDTEVAKSEVVKREDKMKAYAGRYLGAVIVSPILGAVLPVLILHKYRTANRATLLKFAWIPVVIYAIEFALLHGGYGIGAIWNHLIGG